MSELKSYYYIPDIWDSDDLDIEDAIKFKSNRDIDAANGGYDELELKWLVEEMANDYVYNHNGWEICHSWNGDYREFAVWDYKKNFIGKFEVSMEYEPRFDVWRKK